MERYEYAIIGHGAAAFAAAIKANELGIKTAMIGKNATKGTVLGGTCINVGCVPSKRLISFSNPMDRLNYSRFAGLLYNVGLDSFRDVMEAKESLVNGLRSEKYENVLKKLGNVTYINGFASFKDEKTITVNGKEIAAEKFLIATGARAKVPNIEGISGIDYLTSEEALSLESLPKSMIVIGGRALGLEFACMFNHFGVKVTLLQRSDRILPNWEPEISHYLQEYLSDEGIEIITNASIKSVGKKGENVAIKFSKGSKEMEAAAEKVLFATGRAPNTDKLSLDKARVEADGNGYIKVNEYMQTSNGRIFAAGDVTGEPMLEALAAAEGSKATINAFTNEKAKVDLGSVPSAVFTFPEAARVGLTDEEAQMKGIKCACSVVMFKDLPKASIIGDTRGLIKMVVNRDSKQVIGVEILGENAADLINEAALAVKFKLTIDDIIDTVHVFPTLGEAIKLAALSFYYNVEDLSCCSQ